MTRKGLDRMKVESVTVGVEVAMAVTINDFCHSAIESHLSKISKPGEGRKLPNSCRSGADFRIPSALCNTWVRPEMTGFYGSGIGCSALVAIVREEISSDFYGLTR